MSAKITDGWINHLRNSSRQDKGSSPHRTTHVKCPQCEADLAHDLETFRKHVNADPSNHGGLADEDAIVRAFKVITLNKATLKSPKGTESPTGTTNINRKRPGTDDAEASGNMANQDCTDNGRRGNKKVCSPPPSDVQQHGSVTTTPTAATPASARRTRAARRVESNSDFDRSFTRRNRPPGKLFNPGQDPLRPKTPQKILSPNRTQRGQLTTTTTTTPTRTDAQGSNEHGPEQQGPTTTSSGNSIQVDPTRPHTSLDKQQTGSRVITNEQLVREVKGIYAGLVMIEAKCIEVDNAQSANTEHPLSSEQWQALIALHRTLLHEQHDFFLASQHPQASDALKLLAAKYAMPARMWRHGIHSFLELLRHRLPDSYEHMLAFIYLAYSMIALLYETVDAFEDTWIECLGDLARYRMAIEDRDLRDRETWTNVARSWYTIASENSPTTGRLYHHLAILARPNAIQQLYFYTKSLCVPIPFLSARESIMTLFDPLLSQSITNTNPRLAKIDACFVRVHGILFSGKTVEQLDSLMEEYLGLLDGHLGRGTRRWLETGYCTAIPLACSLLGYGSDTHFMMKAISSPPGGEAEKEEDGTSAESHTDPEVVVKDQMFNKALSFAVRTYEIALRQWGDPNTLPFLHTFMAFIFHISLHPSAMVHIEKEFPWKLTAVMLNYLYQSCESRSELRIDSEDFPGPEKNDVPRPLPEDFAMRGLVYTQEYLPLSWFKESKIQEDEKYFELASMIDKRKERILWLARRMSTEGRWLTWDEETRKFGVTEAYRSAAEGSGT